MPLISGATGVGAKQIVVVFAMVGAAALTGAGPSLAKDAAPAMGAASATVAPAAKPDAEPSGPAPGKAGDEQPEAAPDVWSEDEVAQAKAHCANVLRSVKALVMPAEPIKERECGAPAPVRLVSVGRSPEVALVPPVTVTCDMVATLAEWVETDLQPLAKTHLGAPVVRIDTMSSYSCRNAYGRKKTRLSEHGRANAVDVGSFTTSSGVEADLLAGWGMTERDMRAVVAAAEAAAKKAAAAREQPVTKTSASAPAKQQAAPSVELSQAGEGKGRTRLEANAKAVDKPQAGARHARAGRDSASLALSTPSHLGGPNAPSNGAPALGPDPGDRTATFLRAAHSSACRRFGTVLGPEANEAHRNHFHLDMAERTRSNYCE
ncbi:MAG: extensin family protein [Hyphomicrobiaceae bacterium]|nr:extensin family protein [Hyphomicrobiaceae bacterium]